MSGLTRQEMEEILHAHGKAELEFDIDATMATVVPVPHYEFAPLGLAVDGWDAVDAMYRRLIPANTGRNLQIAPRLTGVAENALMTEAYIAFDDARGDRVQGHYLIVIEFDPDLKKVVGERMYADAAFAAFTADNLGADFAGLPGVTKLSDSAPAL